MSKQTPSSPKGFRDFGPEEMARRNYIIQTIRSVYEEYGFRQIETPAVERLDVLTGKYGDEGDQLIFKILNSGDFLSGIKDISELQAAYKEKSNNLTPKIAEKALRYDLTVPFARFVSGNRNNLTFPFRRYQIQPVWRADRPQKGRYREFYQCDADIVGTDSLICEAELASIIIKVFKKLGIKDYDIHINSRKILSAIYELLQSASPESTLFVAIDKLDKIGMEGVKSELLKAGYETTQLNALEKILLLEGNNEFIIEELKKLLPETKSSTTGIEELEKVMEHLAILTDNDLDNIKIDTALARGLSYYTGCIYEVKIKNSGVGSVSGGGRYDDLTGIFGLPDVSGVGISFGIDRLYDSMENLKLFPEDVSIGTKVLIIPFDEERIGYCLNILKELRNNHIAAEIYPDQVKFKKSMGYANKNNVPFVILVGPEEASDNKLSLKNMATGEQSVVTFEDALSIIK